MSAWIRSVTGRAHHRLRRMTNRKWPMAKAILTWRLVIGHWQFAPSALPLNAKQIERPGNMDFKSSVHPLHFDLLAVRQGGRAPALAVEPAFRQVSYARRAQGSTGDCDHFASMQQPADLLCKKVVPGQHRLEAPFLLLAWSKP